ncbi:MAG TPA: hypothetical protein VM715_12460, partial [Candidatus Acidoferrum sp.]|nr:hypothetical protein [Candidatus Acidoferrum sp.]
RSWSRQGEQARVPVSGRNAKRVLYGAMNLRTGHRIVRAYPAMTQRFYQDYLGVLRRAYPGQKILLLLDRAPSPLASLLPTFFGSAFSHAVIRVSKTERLWHMVKNGYGEGEELWRRGLRRRLG